METLTIGLDLGTTGCKAVALTPAGEVRAQAATTYPLLTDPTGRAEQEPDVLWDATCKTLKDLAVKLRGAELGGLALSGAMHSIVPLGRDLEPLAFAITWADSRAGAYPHKLRQETDAAVLYGRTGSPLQTPYHPARLRWLRETQADLFGRAQHFVALKDFILARLCGTLTTDIGLASTTGLLDIHTLKWDSAALELAGISADRLPELSHPTEAVGKLTPEAAAATGLPAGLPIFPGSSDGGLANLGSGVVRPGEVILTLGTSGAVRQVAAKPQLDEAQLTWCYVLTEGHYFAGGAINNGGLTLEWLRRTLYSELPENEGFERLLGESGVAPRGDVLCLPYLTGERTPHWDADLRASFFGLGAHHTRADLARAGLEGVAGCLADVYDLVEPSTLPVQLSGGVTRSDVLVRLITDTLGSPTEVNHTAEASALGAALLAQVGLGMTTLEEGARRAASKAEERLEPDPDAHQYYREKRLRARRVLEATREL